MIISFGKYKGKEFQEVMIDNPEYLLWLHEQDWLPVKYPEIFNLIKRHLNEIRENDGWNSLDEAENFPWWGFDPMDLFED